MSTQSVHTPGTLGALAKVVRSKNAGALLLTLDVMFEDEATYRRVLASNALNAPALAELYGVSHNQISIFHHDIARAIKVTLPRPRPAGDPGDSDVYGAQQHAPLLSLVID
jgi:hypothetical protein